MRIAILTQPLGHNYGGLLQAYALQTYLRILDHEVETLDRRFPTSRKSVVKGYVLNSVRMIQGRIKTMPTAKRQALVLNELAVFRDRNISMSPRVSNDQGVRDYYRSTSFDAFIVGSDQVWRPRYSPSILNYYLDFLDDLGVSAKRLAYAASFGVDEWEYSPKLTERCKQLAQKFDAITVRESSAVRLCEEKLHVNAERAVDPTLLLDATHYDRLTKDAGTNTHAGCVLYYVLDRTPEKRAIAETVGRILGIKVFAIKPDCELAEVQPNELDRCRLPSVARWLQAFRDAQFVVTDSFHGIAFAIIFNKPFIAVGNLARGLTRVESLLSDFTLGERLVVSRNQLGRGVIESEIDWQEVNGRRLELARSGRNFLKDHLG